METPSNFSASDLVARRFEGLMTDEFGLPTDSELSKKWWTTISSMHSEPHRFYHTLTHLAHMFELFDENSSKVQNRMIVTLSILFHDIVYDPKSPRNEEDSADLFKNFVIDINHPKLTAVCDVVFDYIIATKSHAVDTEDGLHLPDSVREDKLAFLAFDMAILSVPLASYREYAKKVRLEYSHVDVEVYCTRRASFLRGVLDGGPVFYGKLDNLAEERMGVNLRWEIELLETGTVAEIMGGGAV
jgi:predicted metal-dependent HD superfamily phosphohydrolase